MKRILILLCLIIYSISHAQWFWQNPLPQGNDLHSVHFIDSNIGWMVGIIGTIFKTTNGGSTWENQISGTGEILRSVKFVNTNDGWISGNNGTILKTTNGGSIWAAQSSGTTEDLYSIYFTDVNTGWAVGAKVILRTTNAGLSWESYPNEISTWLFSVYFIDSNTGWAVGALGTILSTTNGGSSWENQSSGTTELLYSVNFNDFITNDEMNWKKITESFINIANKLEDEVRQLLNKNKTKLESLYNALIENKTLYAHQVKEIVQSR